MFVRRRSKQNRFGRLKALFQGLSFQRRLRRSVKITAAERNHCERHEISLGGIERVKHFVERKSHIGTLKEEILANQEFWREEILANFSQVFEVIRRFRQNFFPLNFFTLGTQNLPISIDRK